jgi:hypothetical protein
MTEYKVTFEKDVDFGWHWSVHNGKYEISDYAFTKFGAIRKAKRYIARQEKEKNLYSESFIVKGE